MNPMNKRPRWMLILGIFLTAVAAGTLAEDSIPGDGQTSVMAMYGQVTPLPDAQEQPRDGSRIVVDVTKGGDPTELNDALRKVVRYVNIYRGAGKAPANAEIAVVLHGDATLTVLNAESYSQRYQTEGNPNLRCLDELNDAGVRILVCGQSLLGQGAKPEEVIESVDVAVSALTSVVNLQGDGYAYVPLGR